jgi:hypothetical protein
MMNKLFYIQLIASFIVGGGFITLLTFIAERVEARVAGIVLTLPSTAALGFFFLGWTLSPDAVANIIPATFIPLGLTVLFPGLYIYAAEYVSRIIKSKNIQIILSCAVSICIWFVIALPIAVYELNNLVIGILGYVVIAILSNRLLNRKNYEKSAPHTYSFGQKVGRSVFTGSIIVLIVFLGKTLSSFWGGIFTMFPAAFLSSLMILHRYYDPKILFTTIKSVPLGSVTLLVYSLTVMLAFPAIGFIPGTVVAYIASLITSLLLSKVQIKQRNTSQFVISE